ncbi:2-oxo acid dehydrogenase subunit E2 [bacterium]|nr:2-oxo acid dehydrogenase subunit E2 [candidate division CSSED10-310 bacterium]
MAYEFKFPDVGEGIHEGKIVEWLVKEGDAIDIDQIFARVETDKAVVELPSPQRGVIQKLHYAAGEIINVGDVMFTLQQEGISSVTQSSINGDQSEKKDIAAAKEDAKEPISPKKHPPLKPLATPHTRAYARKLGVDLAKVVPSGKGGRITDEDVEKASRMAKKGYPYQEPAVSLVTPDETLAEERIKISHLRKIIAENMVLSKHVSAHVTHVDEADVTDLFELYRKAKNQIEAMEHVKFTLLPLFIKAVTVALKSYPHFNASFDDDHQEIVLKKHINIGIAVDTPEGLIVPVIKHADKKDILHLARELVELADKAKAHRLTLEEIKGGTFTITNIGTLGGIFATPIIRQPEIAILGLHAIKDRPVVVDESIKIRKMMYLSLSFDHRIIDGAAAARFMTYLVSLLQSPEQLMLRLI